MIEVSDPTYNAAFNFVDGASQSDEYEYDKNGNLTKDLNKNISSIQYNLLNLPQSIVFTNQRWVNYTYDATGRKIYEVYVNPNSVYFLCSNMMYANSTLKHVLVDGGYITVSGGTPTYHYYLQDHLGNNRVVCNASGTVEQVNHYYPFGGLFGESTNGDAQLYKYNGKELDRMHGLDWYDYGARYMDAMRFTTIDPMAEKYYNMSPYAYCGNNPINAIDINGDSIFYDLPIIEGGKIVDKVRYTYGKYGDTYGFGRNGELYQGNNSTISSISDALNKIASGGSYGNILVSYLSGNTDKDVIIGHGYNKTRCDDGSNYVEVTWDRDDYEGAGIDVNGNTYIAPFITLGHELLHAQNYIEGNINMSPWFSINGKTTPWEEHIVSVRENILRFENNIPMRKYYGVYGTGQKGYPPSLINNPRCLFKDIRL